MRTATRTRTTRETDITVSVNLDGTGVSTIETGIGFFDHMLEILARHALLDLEVRAKGDVQVDFHHTVEDVGLVLGTCVNQALGDRRGICRYGFFLLPMDEALAFAAVDVSGRAYLVYDAALPQEQVGAFDVCLAAEFWRAFAVNSGITLHLRLLYGDNAHHALEAMFKAAGHALRVAAAPREGLLSTKGVL